MVKVGETVPDMKFEVFHDEKIKNMGFSDFRGKWLVLLFYPADFTFVCPTELEEAQQLYPEFKKEGAQIVSFSTDTVFVHKAWHDHSEAIKKIEYPMAADPAGKVCREFGTYIEDEGVSLRSSFIIDPDGKLVAVDMHDNSIGRNAGEILRKLQASRFVREADGEVCPASWKPGQETLKPGLDLVGKI